MAGAVNVRCQLLLLNVDCRPICYLFAGRSLATLIRSGFLKISPRLPCPQGGRWRLCVPSVGHGNFQQVCGWRCENANETNTDQQCCCPPTRVILCNRRSVVRSLARSVFSPSASSVMNKLVILCGRCLAKENELLN